jgi:hypothetical protein
MFLDRVFYLNKDEITIFTGSKRPLIFKVGGFSFFKNNAFSWTYIYCCHGNFTQFKKLC